MKHFYKICVAALLTLSLGAETLLAQTTPTPVMVRDLNAYDVTPNSLPELAGHPLTGQLVTFDAIVVSNPKNSGFASITTAGLPGRIHVFVADVNAIEEGRDGNYIQFVHGGSLRGVMQDLFPGDVIRVEGRLTFFQGNTSQFDPSDITLLGSIYEPNSEYADLEPLLEPQVISLSDINIPSTVTPGTYRWNAANYSKYNQMYVKFEGLEVIATGEDLAGRPWAVLSDGTSIITTTDISLRYRNDRGDSYGDNLSYNYRRLAPELDGPYTPPPTGSVVDLSGYLVVNTTNIASLNESAAQAPLKIAPWDDGIVWTQDGTDTQFRVTEGVNNDMVILGFASLVDRVNAQSTDTVSTGERPVITFTVDLPEDTYTLDEVSITYTALPFTADTAEPVRVVLTEQGGQFSYEFPQYADFTSISYAIEAAALTPENTRTIGRLNGNAFVNNVNVTAPVQFSVPAGTYQNNVTVALSSATNGATIHYTTDGSTPTTSSPIYAGSPLSFDSSVNLRAIAVSSGRSDSPVNSRSYVVEVEATEVSTLAELRQGATDGTVTYRYTGQAVVTMVQNFRGQKWIQDETAAILIDDDNPRVIQSQYQIGDIMTNVLVTLELNAGLTRANPVADPGAPTQTGTVNPMELENLAAIDLSVHESMLVTIPNVRFVTTGNFATTNPTARTVIMKDDSVEEFTFWVNFFDADYIGQPIPSQPLDMTALVGRFNATKQLSARSSADFNFDVSADMGEMVYEFALNQNFPNPFNPTTTINYTIAETGNVNLVVYDILGRRVATLVNEIQSTGRYNVNFDATRLSSGTYIYRLETNGQVATKKMMLIK